MSGPAELAILGSYPPPFGGVANHVQRLMAQLERNGVTYRVYNAVSGSAEPPRVVSVASHRRRWMLTYALTARERVIFILSDRLEVWSLAFLLRLRGKRVILRLRNSALPDWLEGSRLRGAIARRSVRWMSGVVCVSQHLMECARRAGAPSDALLHQPGFIPPALSASDDAKVGADVWRFVARHRPLIAANGKVKSYSGGDLYGLDLLVELCARLRRDHPDLGVVVCFWDHKDEDEAYLEQLRRRARTLGVEEHVLFHTASGPFVPVLAKADLFVRPTNTDGDANSVREALFLGVPAVASDAAERPEATIVFATRDLDALEAAARAGLAAGRPKAPALPAHPEIDRYIEFVLGRKLGAD